MFKHKFIADRTDRQTYIKGWFRGKFIGKLDLSKSDPRQECFYDIEILEGGIVTRQDHLVPWMEGKAPGEFESDPVFPTRLPGKINITLHYLNGEIKHFKIALKQIKLIGCHLSEQVYGRNEVYGTITGLISGYVLHHDMMVKEIIETRQLETADRSDMEQRKTGEKAMSSNSIKAIPPSFKELPVNSTRFFQAIGILIGLSLLTGVILIAKSWIISLLISLSSALGIRRLYRLSSKQRGYKVPGLSKQKENPLSDNG